MNGAADYTGDGLQQAAQVGGQAANVVGDGLQQAAQVGGQAINVAGDGLQQAAQVGGQAANVVGDGLQQAAQVGGQAINVAGDGLQQAAQVGGQAANVAAQVGGQAINVAAQVGGQAINVAGDGLQQAAQVGGQAANGVSEGVSNLQDSKAMGDIKQVAASGAAAAFSGAKRGLDELNNIDFNVDMSALNKVFIPATNSVMPALESLGNVQGMLFDLIKIEIFRDFFQVLSLFFEGLKESMPASFQTFWANIAAFFSICFSCWMNDWYDNNKQTISTAMFYTECGVAIILSVIFIIRYIYYSPSNELQGLDVKSWIQRTTFEVTWAKYAALALTSIYLPVAKDTMQVFSCDLKYVGYGSTCYQGAHIGLITVGVFVLLLYIIPIPIIFIRIIQKNKPKISLYDAEGNVKQGEVAYTDADYKADLARDISPYKSLYDGYERKWAFYKVIVMMMKVLLVTPAALLVSSNSIGHRDVVATAEGTDTGSNNLLLLQSILVLVVLVAYAVTTCASRPFLADEDDMLDAISRGCCVFVAVMGLLTWVVSAEEAFGLLLNIVTSVACFCMLSLFVSQLPAVQSRVKSYRQRIDLTMSRIDPKVPLVFSPELDLHKERKLRVWHEWWDILFVQDKDMRLPNSKESEYKESNDVVMENELAENEHKKKKKKDEYVPVKVAYHYAKSPPYLLNFRNTVAERHLENKEIAAHESFHSYEMALYLTSALDKQSASQLHNDMLRCTRLLTGVDVFWDGDVEDEPEGDIGNERRRQVKPNRTRTKFGKLYVKPFPFCGVVVMDDDSSQAIISLSPVVDGVIRDTSVGMDQFKRLLLINFDPEIVRRRRVRQSLRAMEGEKVYFYYQVRKMKTKSKTGSDGKSQSYSVSVLFTFEYGTFQISRKKPETYWKNEIDGRKINVSHGFSCSLHYRDGHGVDNEGGVWNDEHETIGEDKLGINETYSNTLQLQRLTGRVMDPKAQANARVIGDRFPIIINQFQAYREHYIEEFQYKKKVLSYAFWYYVYNNDLLDRQTLTYVLENHEENQLIKDIPKKYGSSLDVLYGRLAFFDSHPGIAYWFTFWHDVYIHNSEMNVFKENPENLELIDPYNPKSLLYKPLKRGKLEEILIQRKLGGGKRGWIKCNYFHSEMLDKLYSLMERKGTIPIVIENQQNSLLMHDIKSSYGIATHADTALAVTGTSSSSNYTLQDMDDENKTDLKLNDNDPNNNPYLVFNHQQQHSNINHQQQSQQQQMHHPVSVPINLNEVPQIAEGSRLQQVIVCQNPLPQGWIMSVDPNSNRPFYTDTINHKTQWEKPTQPAC